MCLLIRWNAVGTHADVSAAVADEPLPSGAHRIRPGESYFAIPYEGWASWEGRTADVLRLQAYWTAAAKGRHRTLPVSTRLADGGWQEESRFSLSPLPESDYGFSTGTRLVPCSRAELIAQCTGVPETPGVWTPESPHLVSPETVPFLVEALRAYRGEAAKGSVSTALATLLGIGFLALAAGAGIRSGWIVLAGLATAWVAATVYEYRHARNTGPDAFAAAREEHRHALWMAAHRPVYTALLLGMLVVVALAQGFGMEAAIEAAGLVKPAVREGELWRLVTGPLLHGGILHLAMNALGLWSLGPLVEAHAGRAFLALAFLISAVTGSLFSLFLLPDAVSVGASGGILGLAGYLFVLGYRRRHALPTGFVQRMGIGILATAVFGLVGYARVDNATHLGGLLGGMFLALVFPGSATDRSEYGARRIRRWGSLALALLAAAVLWALAAIRFTPPAA
jgi:membrane associated rhomboid family serine protease